MQIVGWVFFAFLIIYYSPSLLLSGITNRWFDIIDAPSIFCYIFPFLYSSIYFLLIYSLVRLINRKFKIIKRHLLIFELLLTFIYSLFVIFAYSVPLNRCVGIIDFQKGVLFIHRGIPLPYSGLSLDYQGLPFINLWVSYPPSHHAVYYLPNLLIVWTLIFTTSYLMIIMFKLIRKK